MSPLHRIHVNAGATFTDFAGWQMPVRYTSDLAEHHAVRTAAGLFDISHMAEITVDGPDAAAFLDYALCGKISAVKNGQAKYSLLLTEAGTVIDDLIVYRRGDEAFFVVANAGNRFAAAEALAERATNFDNVTVTDRSDEFALIAVQGPKAIEVLQSTVDLRADSPLEPLKYYWSVEGWFGDNELLIGRTGYTGEDGFELYIRASAAADLWTALMDAGAEFGLVPAGLACRDTLRLEAGMPLYGHELSLDIYPAQAGLGRVVALSKEGDFVGRAATEAGIPEGSRVLVGLSADGKRAARADYEIFATPEAEEPAGIVTSGCLSPTLGHPIALAYVDPSLAEIGTEVSVDIRGKRLTFAVTKLPFYTREKK
nr:glycine cleavage system aminomethyltransferase GcvT [Lysinibacter cavernae]